MTGRRAANPMRRSWLSDDDGGWIAHRMALLVSPVWRRRPVPLCHVLDCLEIEHCRHGGKENGNLIVTFDQFVAFGVSRKIVKPSIGLGAALGLLEVRQSGVMSGYIKAPNRYRLTYLPEKGRRAPTDEWASLAEHFVMEQIAEFQERATSRRKTARQFPFPPPASSPFAQKKPPASSPFAQNPVPQGEPLYISGGEASKPVEGARSAEEAPPHYRRSLRGGQSDIPDDGTSGLTHLSEALQAILATAKGAV